MENPATWNEVERVIAEEIATYEKLLERHFIGSSLPRRIYRMLAEKGYLKSEYTQQ